MLKLLSDLKNDQRISELNYQFAKLIDRKQQEFGYTEQQKNLAVLLAATMSFWVVQGHSCLNLESDAAKCLCGLSEPNAERDYHTEILQKIGEISPLAWQEILSDHIAFSQDPNTVAPMLFQHNKLYFYRYWQAENRIACALKQAVSFQQKNANPTLDKSILDRFFAAPIPNQIDWQKIAVATALNKNFCLISGGPGTGKTTTVVKLLAGLQLKQLELGLPLLKIGLAAPTGKAAARLKESISASLNQLNLPDNLQESVPNQATTLHRLLGIRPNQDMPYYNAKNPLHLDLLVVDEASMLDLFLMEKLFNALKPHTRLIMLGDKDQLAAVEAGNALSELGSLLTLGYSEAHCNYLRTATDEPIFAQNSHLPSICDSLCHLRISHRFHEDSGIGELARRVNAQQAGSSWQILANSSYPDLHLIHYPAVQDFSDKSQWVQYCVKLVAEKAAHYYQEYLILAKQRAKNPHNVAVADIFAAFQKVRFLSALRVSELGVERLNQTIAETLRQKGLVHFKQSRENYLGKPILMTENATNSGIASGDIGLILPDENGKLRVYFETPQDGKHPSLSPSLLPNYEAAYVMTVHKSQGSEFAHTLMIMPLNANPVLTKELIYTAITRAKTEFTLFADERTWKSAVKTAIQRQSGLKEQVLAK